MEINIRLRSLSNKPHIDVVHAFIAILIVIRRAFRLTKSYHNVYIFKARRTFQQSDALHMLMEGIRDLPVNGQ